MIIFVNHASPLTLNVEVGTSQKFAYIMWLGWPAGLPLPAARPVPGSSSTICHAVAAIVIN